MPIISSFYGINIYMYWDEHLPPHFHAKYNEHSVLIDINDGSVLKGLFPFKQLKLVLAWCELHKRELLNNWENAVKNKEIKKIDPLK